MTSARGIFILLATLSPTAFANDLNGTWRAWFAGDQPDPPTPLKEVFFDFEANGNQLTGLAYLGAWGGVARLSEDKIDGDRFSFTVFRPASFGGSKLDFEGTVAGKELKLALLERNAKLMLGRKVESKVVAPVSENASAADVTGTWKAWFVGHMGDRPKMFSEVVFDFKVDGNTLTGNAHMGNWPGDALISDGKFETGRFSFSAMGVLSSSTGIPRFKFEGTIHGGEMKVTMLNVRADGSPSLHQRELPMEGKKLQ